MKKNLLLILTTVLMLLLLVGCGKPLEEQIDTGITNAETAFKDETLEPNTEIGKIKVYLPTGYTIEESEDHTNYLLKKDNKQMILFVNPNEQKNSKLLYDLYKENQAKEIVEEKTFETEDTFGFTSILQNDEDSFELIVNVGGVKVSTLSSAQNIDNMLLEMMQIARSVSY
ncbi:hypothetical protein UACE39S_02166 [Ureibacillus acetophenoni]|uniref:hypothetical protein n=1 Tax=Ureibacillus sp. MALMAid1270 TaxID=3411629 RepID=UPI003BA72289